MTDVLVLGGGIIGCSLAEELARHGQSVVLLERGRLGGEASTAAAGILSAQTDLQPGPLFDLCQASRTIYPRWVEHLQRRAGMMVGYSVDGVVYVAMSGREAAAMQRRAAWQRKQGLRVERWSAAEVRRQEPAVDGRVKAAWSFPREAQVDPRLLMQALGLACRAAGVKVHENTPVKRLLIREGAIQGVVTPAGEVRASRVVVTLGCWSALYGLPLLGDALMPARGQMLSFLGPKRLLRCAVVGERAYAVQRGDGRIIVGSTVEFAGFEKGLTADGMHDILCGLRQISGAIGECGLLETWSGLRPCTRDRLPVLGATKVLRLYVATGHFRHGILLAPVTARVMRELILEGKPSLDLHPFAPSRFGA